MSGVGPITIDSSVTDWATELAPYGERRLKVIWDISNKCNLRCRMCHFSHDDVFYRSAHYTSSAMFEAMAASVLPLAHTLILSAANEPLMSPHFIDILKIAANYSIPEVLFLSNGQLLSEKIAGAILETGVTQVQISTDGATRETYEYIRRGARFDRLVRNLEYLSARKRELGRSLPRLQFNIVLMRRNLAELPLFVDLAEKVGVEWIAARHLLMMHGLGMEQETLAQNRSEANFHFRRLLQRVDRSKTVKLIEFPDFFDNEQFVPDSAATEDADRAVSAGDVCLRPEEPEICPNRTEDLEPDKKPTELRRAERTITERIRRELCRIPRNVRRLIVPDPPSRPRPKRKKLSLQPFGCIDHPPGDDAQANNAIQLDGWALDRLQVARVTVEREPFAGERSVNSRGLIELGEARIQNGSRPDVGIVFPEYPHSYRAGWSFELRREMVSPKPAFQVSIHAIVHAADGRSADIGRRMLSFSFEKSARPYLFCSKPFDSIFIDSKGDVRPYPDCRPEHPFGSLTEEGTTLRDIWFGREFTDLRRRIIERNPPPMCLTCAHFINRNVDDLQYFVPR